MLRKTKDGGFERQDSEGKWVPVSADEARAASSVGVAPEPVAEVESVSSMIDSLVEEIHSGNGQAEVSTVAEPEVVAPATGEAETPSSQDGNGEESGNGTVLDTESVPGDFDLEVPGLVSGDSGRSSRGFKTVRERLKENARRRREPRKVEVSGSSALVSGPAKKEGTEKRQAARAQARLEAGKSAGDQAVRGQRYVNRPAPSLMSDRPKWVQDLFEAHFRSEYTLGLRRQHNRMKISRADYAIGWLTAFDKFREESSLLRLK